MLLCLDRRQTTIFSCRFLRFCSSRRRLRKLTTVCRVRAHIRLIDVVIFCSLLCTQIWFSWVENQLSASTSTWKLYVNLRNFSNFQANFGLQLAVIWWSSCVGWPLSNSAGVSRKEKIQRTIIVHVHHHHCHLDLLVMGAKSQSEKWKWCRTRSKGLYQLPY